MAHPVTEIFGTLAVLAVFCASIWGLGRLVSRWCYDEATCPWPFAAALGMTVWVFAGGLLNACGFAYGMAIDVLVALGLITFVGEAIRVWQTPRRPPDSGVPRYALLSPESLPFALIAMVGIFRFATLVPTGLFNYHDDFHSYLLVPVRMLDTGAMTSGVFDLLAPSVHGPQAFFHGLILHRLPVTAVNAFDLVLCFVLTGFGIESLGRTLQFRWGMRLVAVLLVVTIHPLCVNVSALYSCSALVVATVCASLRLIEMEAVASFRVRLKAAVPVACLVGALITLKATFVPFALLYSGLIAVVLVVRSRSVPAGVLLVLSMALVTAAFIAPWIGLASREYLALTMTAFEHVATPRPARWGYSSTLVAGLDVLFSRERLWGTTFVTFTVVILANAAIGILALALFARARCGGLLAVGLSASFAATGSYASGLLLYSGQPDLIVRYPNPLLIAVLPVSLLLFVRAQGTGRSSQGGCGELTSVMGVACLLTAVVVLCLYAAPAVTTVSRLVLDRSLIPFRMDDDYGPYVKTSLEPAAAEEVLAAQEAIEPGRVLMAWMTLPFRLDFARNPIVPMDGPGAYKLALRLGRGADAEDLRQFLLAKGIEQVMWQHEGYGVRRGIRVAGLQGLLSTLARRSDLLHDDRDGIVAFDIASVESKGRGSLDEKLSRLRRTVERSAHDPWAWHDLAVALHESGELQMAIGYYRAALRLAPEMWRTHHFLGEALRATGDGAGAVVAGREALRIRPGDAAPHEGLARALVSMANDAEAVKHLRRVLQLAPHRAGAHHNLAASLERLGRRDLAIEHYRQEIQQRSDAVPTISRLAAALLAAGRAEEAIETCRAALRSTPDSAQLYLDLAGALAGAGRLDQAAVSAQRALDLASKAGRRELADEIRAWLHEYDPQ